MYSDLGKQSYGTVRAHVKKHAFCEGPSLSLKSRYMTHDTWHSIVTSWPASVLFSYGVFLYPYRPRHIPKCPYRSLRIPIPIQGSRASCFLMEFSYATGVCEQKRPSRYIATNMDIHYSQQHTSRNAYRYTSLYIAIYCDGRFFADTSIDPYISLYIPIHPYISLYIPIDPYISL